jgi:hypothetical protein
VYDGLRETLISPNEADRNLEPANVVDGLYALMRAVRLHARVYALDVLIQHGTVDQRDEALRWLALTFED